MRRKNYQDNGPNASQRALRVGELVRQALAAGFLALFTSPAMAEVCDKIVGDGWRPGDGAIWLLNPSASPLVTMEYAAIGAGTFLLAAIRRRWAGYIAGLLVAIVALSQLYTLLLEPDDVTVFAFRKRCLSPTTAGVDIGTLAAAAFLLVWAARRLDPVKVAPS